MMWTSGCCLAVFLPRPSWPVWLPPSSNPSLPCAQIGFPLQYNQYPLLRALWNIRFMAQVRWNTCWDAFQFKWVCDYE